MKSLADFAKGAKTKTSQKKSLMTVALFLLFSSAVGLFIYTADVEEKEDSHPITERQEAPVEQEIEVILTTGTYKVGKDIPPGKYEIEAISGTGTVHKHSSTVFYLSDTYRENYYESYDDVFLYENETIRIEGPLTVEFTSEDYQK